MANVVASSDRSKILHQAQATDTHELQEEIQDLRQLVDSRLSGVSSEVASPSLLQPSILTLYSGDPIKGADALLEGRRGLEVQVI